MRRQPCRMPTVAALAFLLSWQAPPATEAAEESAPYRASCRATTERVERLEGLPKFLLTAISLAETGRWDAAKRASFAWPWTITSGGKAAYFPTKADAVAAVERLRQKGVRNIDVGCMQVNLGYHPEAFASLEAALDPATNVAYAAAFLRRLHDETRSWARSVAFYHSRDKARYQPYRNKVYKLWRQVKRAVTAERRRRWEAERRAKTKAKSEARAGAAASSAAPS